MRGAFLVVWGLSAKQLILPPGFTARDMMLLGCAPRGAFQWHAAWHFAAAAALWLLYAFLRSERPRLADARHADSAERHGT